MHDNVINKEKDNTMRKLIYIPIIHTNPDMGSIGKELIKKSVDLIGERKWQLHTTTVVGYWNAIESFFEDCKLNVKGIKIYQDGMFVDGEPALKIIQDGVKSGSKNSAIVSKLMGQGAQLIKTEDFKLVKKEYDCIHSIIHSKNSFQRFYFLLKYKILKPVILLKRDKFIANRIAETLGNNETGILFIGAYHNIINKIPSDITVVQLKEIAKIIDYQKTIQSSSEIKTEQIEYLTQKIVPDDEDFNH